MANFDTLESSVEESSPIELYTITIGSEVHRYTSNSADITITGNTWAAEPISRSKIEKSSGRKEVLLTTFSAQNTFARSFMGIVPGQRAFLTIIRLQRDESPAFNTQILIYKGQISGGKYSGNGTKIELQSRSVEAATSRTIPRFTFMGMCNHILFDNGCKKSSAGFTVTGPVATIADTVYTVTGANGQPDGFWTGGWVTPVGTNDYRMVLTHVGNDITLLLPFATDITGTDVEIYAGCDHTLAGACANKFDNVLEFGGFPFVPTKNVFETGL
jgi:uncharacterized phage protein (TIGR02218 family)